MSSFDGVWETVTETPMGTQKATLTLKSEGDKLSGSSAGAMGTMQLENGKLEGNRATWAMQFMGITLTAVAQHLQALEESGLVHTEKVGRVRTCRIETSGFSVLEQWIADHRTIWERRLDRLGELLAEPDE